MRGLAPALPGMAEQKADAPTVEPAPSPHERRLADTHGIGHAQRLLQAVPGENHLQPEPQCAPAAVDPHGIIGMLAVEKPAVRIDDPAVTVGSGKSVDINVVVYQ